MSQDNVNGSAMDSELDQVKESTSDSKAKIDSVDKGNTDTVAYSTLQRSVDREKRAKERARELEAELEQFREQQRRAEEEKMSKNEEWKQLAKTKDSELNKALEEVAGLRASIANDLRKRAIERELGGLRKPEFMNFIDLKKIEIVDGIPDEHEVKMLAEEFKKNYPELLTEPTNKSKMTSRAAVSKGDDEEFDLDNREERTQLLDSLF